MRVTILGTMTAAALLVGCPSAPNGPAPASSSASAPAPIPSGMPIDRFAVVPQRSEDRYQVDASALRQVIALATAEALPLSKTSDGYRVLRADEGSVLERAGFRVGDELLRIANVPVLASDLLVQLHPVWEQPQFQVAYRRGGEERSHTYELQRPRPPRVARDDGDGAGGSEAMPFDQEAFAKGVHRAADGTIVVKREVFDMLLADQSTVMRSARLVPRKEGDRVTGLTIFGIRRGSPIAVLGFESGDVLGTVAGYDISSPDQALEAYSKVKDATKVDVVVVRNGEPLTLRYRLVE